MCVCVARPVCGFQEATGLKSTRFSQAIKILITSRATTITHLQSEREREREREREKNMESEGERVRERDLHF